MNGLENTEKTRGLTNGYKCLQFVYECLRTAYEPYDYLTIHLPNLLKSFANATNDYECPCKFCKCLRTTYEWNDCRRGDCDRDMGRGKSDHPPPEEKCSHTVENMVANGLTNAIRHQFAMITRWSPVFVSIRGLSWGVTIISNMLLKIARKPYLHCFRNIFVSNRKPFLLMARHL